jgi:hypothetical protein
MLFVFRKDGQASHGEHERESFLPFLRFYRRPYDEISYRAKMRPPPGSHPYGEEESGGHGGLQEPRSRPTFSPLHLRLQTQAPQCAIPPSSGHRRQQQLQLRPVATFVLPTLRAPRHTRSPASSPSSRMRPPRTPRCAPASAPSHRRLFIHGLAPSADGAMLSDAFSRFERRPRGLPCCRPPRLRSMQGVRLRDARHPPRAPPRHGR